LALLPFFTLTIPAHAANSQTTAVNVSISSALRLSLASPCAPDPAKSTLDLTLNPTPAGVVSSCYTVITVNSNTPGYSLLFKADTATLNHTSVSGKVVNPTTNNTTPASLNSNSWGFAVPSAAGPDNTSVASQTLTSYSSFDSAYTQRTDDPLATTTDKYATTPTTETEIKHLLTGNYNNDTVVSNDKTTVYYAATADMGTLAGQYTNTITYTAVGEEGECRWDSSMTATDPNCKEPIVSVACTSGPAFKGHIGNIKDAATTTATWAIGDTGIATDARNGQDYCIGKLADSKVWMLNNLRIALPDIAAASSSLSNPNVNFSALSDPTTFGNGDYDPLDGSPRYTNLPRYYDPACGADNALAAPDCGDPDNTNINSDHFYGYLYNWCAAMGATTGACPDWLDAPTDLNGGSGAGFDPAQTTNICPANWRLPTGDLTGEAAYLNGMMAGDGTYSDVGTGDYAANWQFAGPARGVLSGIWLAAQGFLTDGGILWTPSLDYNGGVQEVFVFGFDDFSVIPGTESFHLIAGMAVRCIIGS
jgi:hypothetical protein